MLIRSRALALLMNAEGQSCSGIAAVVDYHVRPLDYFIFSSALAYERTRD